MRPTDELRWLACFVRLAELTRDLDASFAELAELDMTPKGRIETQIMDWVKRNDEYATSNAASCCHAAAGS